MTDRPGWRTIYDDAERALAPVVESVAHSSELATVVGLAAHVRRAVGGAANGVAAQLWHWVNLPAGTDVQRLRVQVGALDREVRRLTLQLERSAR